MMNIPTKREQVKSNEEWHFILWLRDCVEHGLVVSWEYEPERFELIERVDYVEPVQLKTKVSKRKKMLHGKKTYTPDWRIEFSELGLGLWKMAFEKSYWIMIEEDKGERIAWVDTKGACSKHKGSAELFELKRCITYDIYNFWTEKCIPFYSTGKKDKKVRHGLFVDTFAPESLRNKVYGGLNITGKACVNITEFMKTYETKNNPK